MRRSKIIIVLAAVFCAGCSYFFGDTYGEEFNRRLQVRPISKVITSERINGLQVRIKGKVSSKSQFTGSWIMVNDGSGEIKVVFDKANFRAPYDIVGKKVQLIGRINVPAGNKEVKIDISSLIVYN